jgi:ATP-GRASP peptide maturase of grasp-with-spasm system
LNHYGEKVVVINADDELYKFYQINGEGIYFRNTLTNKIINLNEVKSCWWRRSGLSLKSFRQIPSKTEFIVDGKDLGELIYGSTSYLKAEADALREYIFSRIYEKSKINIGRPDKYGLNRLTILELAKQKGFKIPHFEIVTNTHQIVDSKGLDQKFVTKAIAEGVYHQIENEMFYSYTELAAKTDYANARVELFPSLLSNLVQKKFEIRSFYLEGNFYSMAIFSQSSSQTSVDFRKYNNNRPNKKEPFQLPAEVEERLRSIFEEIELNCGSADLIVDEKGDYVFLEINPVGQYQMTSEPCNYNLDKIIAKYLIHGRIE